MFRLTSTFALLLSTFTIAALAAAIDGCSSASDGPGSKPDGATTDDATSDGGPDGANGKGETCIGFAKGAPCGANGFPDYGYVCFNGSPPGIAGCKLATSSSLGSTYCCMENKCVAQPDQDKECKASATPHRYQCPPEGDGGSVAPPAGCTNSAAGGSALELFFCCP